MIALVDYGAGNLRSVEFALDRLGIAHRRAAGPEDARSARGIILPGVGAAASAMAVLETRGWPEVFRLRDRPLLGICLGMQLLCEASDEGGTATAGLGLVPGTVRRFSREVPRVPHVGWNQLAVEGDDPLFRGIARDTWVYFLHSYRADCPAHAVSATADCGEMFPAAVRSGDVAGVQFHPEKSGSAGARVLENFCRTCGAC